jgi:2-succinyl-5-enolpyruvyl-6-hydroxy-3-cyclohexene-1-carboxylate synthase
VTCSAIDAVLRAAPAPDLILELGAPPTSSAYAEIAAACPARFVVAPHGHGDPHGDALALIQADPGAFARALAAELPPRIGAAPPWAASLARADAHATARIDAAIGDTFGEAEVARALLAACPEGTLLAVGNSTPVRDLDAYVPASARDVRVLSQRGASGIDGLLSGAAGARSVTSAPVALLLGDLSLFHDLSALALAARSPGPFVIVVVQNGGGRIFEQLPIARAADPDLFDRCFTTPVDVRFEHAAAAFGLPYTRVEGRAALDEALASAFAGARAVLIEAFVPPHGGAALASRVRAALAADRPHVSPPEKAS